jgi:hypothetical protein
MTRIGVSLVRTFGSVTLVPCDGIHKSLISLIPYVKAYCATGKASSGHLLLETRSHLTVHSLSFAAFPTFSKKWLVMYDVSL